MMRSSLRSVVSVRGFAGNDGDVAKTRVNENEFRIRG